MCHELLICLIDESGNLIGPSSFLKIAEQCGLIQEIDRWVLRAAIRHLARAQAAGDRLLLSVNLSAKALADRELLQVVRRELAGTSVDLGNLVIEITETAAIADLRRAKRFMNRMRALGCRFALDDFGVGFSSLNHVKSLPLDIVKIDGTFIRHLPYDRVDQHIVQSICYAAQGMGRKTVAEFVGNEETVQMLKELGVDYGQGYFLGRPMPMSSFLSGSGAGLAGAA
jgi:EAL domain-containing protein (putative c-di-GMP-specific phosphodiesterase class I)